VKFFRAIAAYLSIALLTLVSMTSHRPAAVVAYPAQHHEQSQLSQTSAGDLPYCLTEQQRYSSATGQGAAFGGFKQHFDWAALKPIFLNARRITGIGYFLLTRFLLVGFSSTDVIFPFHQFW
jgi:hypothetical protein